LRADPVVATRRLVRIALSNQLPSFGPALPAGSNVVLLNFQSKGCLQY